MKQLLAVLFAAMFAAASVSAIAQDKKAEAKKEKMEKSTTSAKKEPTAAQKKRQACNEQATERKLQGDERKKFMSSCTKPAAKQGAKKTEKMETKPAK